MLCATAVFAVGRCRPMSVSHVWRNWRIVSRRLKISIKFFLGLVALHDSSFLRPFDFTQLFIGEPAYVRAIYARVWENLRVSTEIADYLGNGTRQAHGCYMER